MVSSTEGVRLRVLVGVAAVTGVVAWLALRLVLLAGRGLPVVTWAPLPVLLVVAVALYLFGRPVKKLVDGTATKRVHPLYAARVLAFAQAGALTGAVGVGWYLAQAVILLPDVDVASLQQTILQLVVLALGAAALSASGLLVQRMCRIDRGKKDRPGGPDRRGPDGWNDGWNDDWDDDDDGRDRSHSH